ncbi:hypothetical protein D9Q98_002273 [Chlorella vulgaris]|uniref:Uncharacterized protein n=1 Tax=Chlorella vulgaris TaxID=3077 RepID=A0A9D4TW55_CHLVU|nr:hypothetical protein D9Q98_002273 [Chlorella vulgaris]
MVDHSAAALVDYDALRTEWAAFFGLLYNDQGIKLRVNLPDTLVLQRGRPHAWFATNAEGYVVHRCAAFASMEDVRQHLLK